MAETPPARKTLTEIVLMPLVIAGVGISGTLLVTKEQARHSDLLHRTQLESTERMATSAHEVALQDAQSQKELRLLEIVAEKLLSKDATEQQQALHLMEAVDPAFAQKLAGGAARFTAQPEVRRVAEAALATRLELRVGASPLRVAPGERTTITATVVDAAGRPVPGAEVTVQAGGGRFLQSASEGYDPKGRLHAPYSASGTTGADGRFTTWWVCNPCAGGYGMGAKASKLGHLPAEASFDVAIR